MRKYVLEEWKKDEATWVQRLNITTLHVTIKKIESKTRYRVCAANEIGYKETSCSKSVELGRSKICGALLVSPDFFESWKYYLKNTRIFCTSLYELFTFASQISMISEVARVGRLKEVGEH